VASGCARKTLKLCTSSDHINRPLYNDISYLTSDNRFLIFMQHQSTVNPNMPLREAMYYFELLRQWLTKKGVSLSARVMADVPKPEFYAAYQGKRQYNMQSLLFSNDFLEIRQS